MKKILYILTLFIAFATTLHAQDEEGGKIRDRMKEYIQKRLNLSSSEAEKFGPVFMNYLNDLRRTNQQYKDDKLIQQQKVADLRLQYRNQFKDIMGDKKSNDVFTYERDFRQQLIIELRERQSLQSDLHSNKRGGGLLQ